MVIIAGSWWYKLSPTQFVSKSMRISASQGLAIIYSSDIRNVKSLVSEYDIVKFCNKKKSAADSWHQTYIKTFKLDFDGKKNKQIPLFVYDRIDAENLKEVRLKYQLDTLRNGAVNEFDAIIKTGAWIGTKWNHGVDNVPGGRRTFRICELIDSGLAGNQYWCEIAAKATVQVATAMGWPARLVSTSRNGEDYEHAVAEVWTNTYKKWFVLDTDFNCVFYANSIPLSAFELCHYEKMGLTDTIIHQKYFAPLKKGLSKVDLLPYFKYIQIDLRNDWFNRRLKVGSPAGGDISTWWTGRLGLPPQLTIKRRINDQSIFDWHINTVELYLDTLIKLDKAYKLALSVRTYSSYFGKNIYRVNNGDWNEIDTSSFNIVLNSGVHKIAASTITIVGDTGEISASEFELE
jgi:hypothetical protein